MLYDGQRIIEPTFYHLHERLPCLYLFIYNLLILYIYNLKSQPSELLCLSKDYANTYLSYKIDKYFFDACSIH